MEQQNFNSPQQPDLTKLSSKGVKPFWPIVLLILVVALVGVLLWQKNNANQIADFLQQQIIALQNKFIDLQVADSTNKIATTTLNKNISWKKFSTDSRLSLPQKVIDAKPEFTLGVLSFRHPDTWKVTTFPVSLEGFYRGIFFAGYIQLSKQDPSQPQSKSDLPENTAYIQISVGTTPLSPREFVDGDYLGRSSVYDNISDEKLFLGYDAIKIYQTDIFPDSILFKVSPTTFFIITSEIYSSSSTSSLYYKETSEEINEILSTFKFTK